MKNITLFLSFFVSLSLNAQILGFIEAKQGCSAPTEVFIAEKKNLLFQIHVPINGNFEVKLNPGKYQIIAVNEEGCEGREQVEFKKEQINLTLKIGKVADRKPSMMETGVGYSMDMWGVPYPGRSPWWYPWSMYQYPMSYRNPCMWNIWGCGGGWYPGGGGIAMGKPNIYIVGPDIQAAKISLTPIEHHQLMATAPAHMEKGWTFNLEKNKLIVGGTTYPYLFYDSRAEVKKLINHQNGFCGDRPEVLQKMGDILEKMAYPKKAQKDFNEHWWAKFPKLTSFCVYPQVNDELSDLAPLQISLPSYSLTRIAFFVISRPKRSTLPVEPFLKEMIQRKPAAWVAPVKKADHPQKRWQVYEWGVAFPFETEKK
jgi:hypothetical protein